MEDLVHTEVWARVEAWMMERSVFRSPRGHLSYDSVALLVGPSGVGKSYGLRRLIDLHGWDTVEIDQEKIGAAKQLQEVITKGITTNLLQSLSGRLAPRVMVLDNADALFHNERMYITYLAELLERTPEQHALPHMPILLTCSYATEKKLGPLRRCQQFTFRALSEGDIFLYLKKHFRLHSAELMRISEACDGSLRAAIGMATSAATGAIPAPVPIARRDVVAEQPMLYEARAQDIRQIRSLIGDKLWISPLLFHENLPTELERRKGLVRAKLDYYREYLWALATWDVWMADNCEERYEYPVELIARCILRMGELFSRKAGGARGDPGTREEVFTRLFSTLSIQKKTARAMYTPSL